MKACRNLSALFLALALCALFPGEAWAMSFGFGGSLGGESGGEKTITAVGNPDPLATELLFLDPEADWAAAAADSLPASEPCQTADGGIIFCPVHWALSGLDFSVPGRQFIPGTLAPEETCLFADGVSDAVSYPVYFTGGAVDTETLSALYVDALNPYFMELLPVGGDLSALELCGYRARCLTAGSAGSFSCPLQWDFSGVDSSAAGTYTASATAQLPSGFAAPADAEPITAQVGVVDPDAIDLSAHHMTEFGNLECDYLYASDLTGVSMEYAVGDGAWTQDPAVLDAGHLRGTYFEMGGTFAVFFLNLLAPQTDYHFRFSYENGRVSNEITLRLSEAGSTQPVVTMGGDRDGGGSDSLPDLIQPLPGTDGDDSSVTAGDSGGDDSSGGSPAAQAPVQDAAEESVPQPEPAAISAAEIPAAQEIPELPDGVPTAAAAPSALSAKLPAAEGDGAGKDVPAEVVTDTYTALSGLRLRQLLDAESGGTVLFEKGGVSVELSSDFLSQLALGDTDLLCVTIRQPAEDSFLFSVTAAGEELTLLPATAVRLSWSGPQSGLECVDSTKAHVSDAVYDAETKTVSCTVSAPGTYSIRAVPAPQSVAPEPLTASVAAKDVSGAAPQQSGTSVLSAFAPLLAAAAAGVCGFFVLRRRHA